jgi:hypothetical protein
MSRTIFCAGILFWPAGLNNWQNTSTMPKTENSKLAGMVGDERLELPTSSV